MALRHPRSWALVVQKEGGKIHSCISMIEEDYETWGLENDGQLTPKTSLIDGQLIALRAIGE
jgi:hypothetical protein